MYCIVINMFLFGFGVFKGLLELQFLAMFNIAFLLVTFIVD
jgi:hypothetical protein